VSLLTAIGGGSPSGALGSITGTLGAVSSGDMVIVFVAWAVSGATNQLATITDPTGQAWTVVPMSNNTGDSGGFGYCIANQGWTTNTFTATLTAGTPGGRVFLGSKLAAAMVGAPPIDQHITGTKQVTTTPSTSTGALAAANSLAVAFDLQRAAASTVASFTWGAGWTADGSAVGGGTPVSGIFLGELAAAGTAPVTATGTSLTATDDHELDVLVIELAGAPPPPPAPSGVLHVPVRGRRLADVGVLRVDLG
jgi:hypothetical protein